MYVRFYKMCLYMMWLCREWCRITWWCIKYDLIIEWKMMKNIYLGGIIHNENGKRCKLKWNQTMNNFWINKRMLKREKKKVWNVYVFRKWVKRTWITFDILFIFILYHFCVPFLQALSREKSVWKYLATNV